MSDNVSHRPNRISVCPLSSKGRRMKSNENYKDKTFVDFNRVEQVYAVKSYSDQRNNQALIFLEGEILTVLEKFPDGMCNGYISRLGPDSKTGIFPIACVVPFTKNNINSYNPIQLGKFTRKHIDIKNRDKSNNSPIPQRDKKNTPERNNQVNFPTEGSHMYSCNCIEIRKSQNPEIKDNTESLNRSSCGSVDSGRGSASVTLKNNTKMATPFATFDQTQHIPENHTSQSMESGLASYQRHSLSSNSSIGVESISDCCKPHSEFTSSEHERIGNNTSEQGEHDEHIIKNWLQKINLEIYLTNFISSGYDFNTLLRMTPEDLNAIGITNPKHRKLIKQDISGRICTIKDRQLESVPATVEKWLIFLNLIQYFEVFVTQGYDSVAKIIELTWEDLEDIGITKLGHQKKLMIAIEKLKKLIKNSNCDKLPISYSAENFCDQKSRFISSDMTSNSLTKSEAQRHNLSHLSSPFQSNLTDSCLILQSNPPFSPNWSGFSNVIESILPPPTPKRISSISSNPNPDKVYSKKSIRKPYENLNESIEMMIKIKNSNRAINDTIFVNAGFRGSDVKFPEINPLPFANENCGTIKQRSSSLDRTDLLREELEFGILNLKSNILSSTKSVFPLNLPYNVDAQSHKATNLSQNFKITSRNERNIQMIPTHVQISAREKVPLPKLHIDDNSSNEDYNEICDMLEDLTELLDKETSQNY